MARFLLIHGAAHGAWCWRDVIPALQGLGHSCRAIDLPSHGQDKSPPEHVTLEDYARAIIDAVDAPTIIVGHSMAGYPITLAAEMAPDKVAGLIYLTAYTPWPGMTLGQMRRLAANTLLQEAIRVAPDGKTLTYDPALAEAVFYHDCPAGTLDYALPRLSRQSLRPMQTEVSPEQSLNLPRSYIVCEQDRAIAPELQHKMAAKLAPENVYKLDTSHSPFFSAPDRLAQILNKIAEAT